MSKRTRKGYLEIIRYFSRCGKIRRDRAKANTTKRPEEDGLNVTTKVLSHKTVPEFVNKHSELENYLVH
jgi:hypothetical protein